MVAYKENFVEYMLCLALDVGEGMLKNGAEISRVEDTIERICRAYGAEHVEVFTIVSVINAAVRMPDGVYSSQMRRVKATTMNLYKLEELNNISRQVCATTPALEEFDERIKTLKSKTVYPVWLQIISFAVAAGAFAVFFGGGVIDTLIAMLSGALMFCIENYTSRRLNGIAKTVLSSFAVSLISGLSVILGFGSNGGAIIMGALMLLVPGVAIGLAMRDVFCGDILSGTLKLLQACLTALMIAFGYILAAMIIGGGVI